MVVADWVVAIGVSCVGGIVSWAWDGTLMGMNFMFGFLLYFGGQWIGGLVFGWLFLHSRGDGFME